MFVWVDVVVTFMVMFAEGLLWFIAGLLTGILIRRLDDKERDIFRRVQKKNDGSGSSRNEETTEEKQEGCVRKHRIDVTYVGSTTD